MNVIKDTILAGIGLFGSLIIAAFGGWNAGMIMLISFMAADYITGLIVAGVFKKSPKSANGGLESKAGLKGICRKVVILFLVFVAGRIDIMMGSNFLMRNMVIIAFAANEAISICENAGLMGVPIPAPLKKAIDVLKKSGDDET